jgi:hypothetical protein
VRRGCSRALTLGARKESTRLTPRRVRVGVASHPSHRSGRARLTHPARPTTGSLRTAAPTPEASAQARRRPGARGVGVRPPPSRCAGGVAGRPQLLGNPVVPRPCSPTPAGPEPPGPTVVRRGPRLAKTEGYPRVSQSRGSIAGRRHSLSTLRGVGCPPTTPDSLPAAGQALPGGIGYPQGSDERFP